MREMWKENEDKLRAVREAIKDKDLGHLACRLAISILLQTPVELTEAEKEWALGAVKDFVSEDKND